MANTAQMIDFTGLEVKDLVKQLQALPGDVVLDIMSHHGYQYDDNITEEENETLLANLIISDSDPYENESHVPTGQHFMHDKDNSDNENAWVEITPIMAVANVSLRDIDGQQVVSIALLRPLALEDEEEEQVALGGEYELGNYDSDRELTVEIDGEYLYVRIMTEEREELLIQYMTEDEGIVLDVFKDGEKYKSLGCVFYSDLQMDSDFDEEPIFSTEHSSDETDNEIKTSGAPK
jgi:hypothetical protein